jgi:hypothetical protein
MGKHWPRSSWTLGVEARRALQTPRSKLLTNAIQA